MGIAQNYKLRLKPGHWQNYKLRFKPGFLTQSQFSIQVNKPNAKAINFILTKLRTNW